MELIKNETTRERKLTELFSSLPTPYVYREKKIERYSSTTLARVR